MAILDAQMAKMEQCISSDLVGLVKLKLCVDLMPHLVNQLKQYQTQVMMKFQ